ncbi:Coenzyme F420-reducing hydrogenase, alpha subunit [Streptomyces sp. SceaMP-e96]|uniref:Ni/Fe hydrogenase subunit alpha n=1 Tax=unclassified Streptomyces TaxID=2593676 RepID=UPI000823DA69|nr:nickel-dependent hydrogenase large subunit [Streptomyces sp. SceaMP-e96]MYT16731.1 Ni/Fe hydrogenase subunit alpha [Streptomyces sp. SID4951]SCK34805.1 Coenzyme F420-reducing hydrogenase, alpha subunit [Streptomyces sp. SceaMP-e96]
MTHRESKVLRVASLARVEGEGALYLRLHGGEVAEARLKIYEPPRFFEAFLRGRSYTEPPDLTSRVCGICPVAYQMSACRAIEDACGIVVDGQLAALRRLLYCGEWIESQTLHIYMLHAPDFLGADSIIDLARTHRTQVEQGLRLKQTGNSLMELLGGRAIHPVNVRLGGFHRVPAGSELRPLAERLKRARDDAEATVRWVSGFDFPDARTDAELLALAEPGSYAIDSGTPTAMAAPSTAGLPVDRERALPTRTFPLPAFSDHVVETQVPHSTALHSTLDGNRHLTGTLARYAISGRWLPPDVLETAREAGLGDAREGTVCRNPFRSIIVRAIEVLYAVGEALRLIAAYEPPPHPYLDVPVRAGTGHGATEAPRGLLYHRYALDADGTVTEANVVPPTSQNQAAIEQDLRRAVQQRLDSGPHPTDDELTALCERVIRNHDPCISCSTHFLDLTVARNGTRRAHQPR